MSRKLFEFTNPISGQKVDAGKVETWVSGIGGVLFLIALWIGGNRLWSWGVQHIPGLAPAAGESYEGF